MKIPIEMMKEIRESGYDKKLVYSYIRELLDSDKEIKENKKIAINNIYFQEFFFLLLIESLYKIQNALCSALVI